MAPMQRLGNSESVSPYLETPNARINRRAANSIQYTPQKE